MKLNAAIVIKTKNGYAVCPFSGELPRDLMLDMEVAVKLESYSYATDTVIAALARHFEPKEKAADPAPITPPLSLDALVTESPL